MKNVTNTEGKNSVVNGNDWHSRFSSLSSFYHLAKDRPLHQCPGDIPQSIWIFKGGFRKKGSHFASSLGICYLKVIRKASSWHITSMATSWYISWWYVVKGIVWQMEIRMFVVRYFLLPLQIEKIWFVVLIPLSPSICEHSYPSSIFIEVSPVEI